MRHRGWGDPAFTEPRRRLGDRQMAKRTGERASNSAAARARNCDVERAEIESQSCGSERRSLHGGGLRRSQRRCPRAANELLACGGASSCRRATLLSLCGRFRRVSRVS
eukprot:scaffold66752_cov36-Phaeocystis_antarctica.AAC.1